MKLKEMREKVKSELAHIPNWDPRWNLPQNDLRMIYWSKRMHSLGKKAEVKKTKEEILEECIKVIKKDYPDFTPRYDKNFFKL